MYCEYLIELSCLIEYHLNIFYDFIEYEIVIYIDPEGTPHFSSIEESEFLKTRIEIYLSKDEIKNEKKGSSFLQNSLLESIKDKELIIRILNHYFPSK